MSEAPTSSGLEPVSPRPSSSSLDPKNQLDRPPSTEVLAAPTPPRDEFRVTPISFEEQQFRHSGWAVRRRQVYDCLCRLSQTPARIDRFCNCGSGCVVEANTLTGDTRFAANYCHDRLCAPCGAARSSRVTRALIAEAGQKMVRFCTFTLRHSNTPLKDQIDRLYRSFAALRRRRWFLDRVSGGAAVLEIKLGREGLWHVHLHCLVLGKFLPQADLAKEWHAVTGDSYIVDVRKVDDGHNSIRYVSAYVGKPVDASIYQDPARLDEAATALRGRRVINTWGVWAKLDLDADDDTGGVWVVVGTLRDLLRDAANGDRAAAMMLKSMAPRERQTGPPHDDS